jgi:hypothetical protein
MHADWILPTLDLDYLPSEFWVFRVVEKIEDLLGV